MSRSHNAVTIPQAFFHWLPVLTVGQTRILLYLLRYAPADGALHVPQHEMAKNLGLSTHTCCAAMRALVAIGLVRKFGSTVSAGYQVAEDMLRAGPPRDYKKPWRSDGPPPGQRWTGQPKATD